MAVRKCWLECTGVVLLTASAWQDLRAEDLNGEVEVAQAATVDLGTASAPVIFEETVDTGFVFLDSEYLPPPYRVQATADSVTLNGRPWPVESGRETFADEERGSFTADHEAFAGSDDIEPGRPMGRSAGWGGRWRGDSGGFSGGRLGGWNSRSRLSRMAARRLVDDLSMGAVVVVASGRMEIIYSDSDQQDFLVTLLNRNARPDEVRMMPTTTASKVDFDRWNDWVSGVTVTADLRTRAGRLIEDAAVAAAMNDAAISANRRLDTFAYPLTVLGMMLGVVALGHLLKSFSRLDDGQDNLLPPEVLRATTISIGLVVALSLFDLTWTILASQAGQMRELNPLGSRLITDPTMLIAFKFVATLVGCGLLFALRHHRRARLACWWLCLVCTVLTFRWVMFNSMFVA